MRAESQSKERQATEGTVENMTLDDFIVPNSVASPANISRSPSAEIMNTEGSIVASAIPLKKQNELRGQTYPFGTSAPGPQAPIQQRAGEFGYVQRYVRKTSIDERRVCLVQLMLRDDLVLTLPSHQSDEPSIRPRFSQ